MFTQHRKDPDNFQDFATKMTKTLLEGDICALNNIIDELATYDVYDVIARISSLNLIIENQNKSTLLDALIAGILSRPRQSYQGKSKMSSGKFRNIINSLETLGLKIMVDPSENAFIERVRYYGNYWIFPGINYSPSYCLQGFLNVLCLRNLKMDDNFTRKAHQLINLVLQISNMIAQSLEFDLDTLCHVEENSIKLPESQYFNKIKKCITLHYSLIENLLDDEDLRECLFSEFGSNNIEQVIDGEKQEFFAHPFLKTNENTVILLNPSILASFAVHQLITLADSYGIREFLVEAYNNEIWLECRRDLQKLGHKKFKKVIMELN